MSILEFYVVSFVSISGIVVLLSIVAKARLDASTSDSSSERQTIRRHSDHVQIISEHDDGYGIALVDMDNGYELRGFDGAGEVTTTLWLRESELADVTEALRVTHLKNELEATL